MLQIFTWSCKFVVPFDSEHLSNGSFFSPLVISNFNQRSITLKSEPFKYKHLEEKFALHDTGIIGFFSSRFKGRSIAYNYTKYEI